MAAGDVYMAVRDDRFKVWRTEDRVVVTGHVVEPNDRLVAVRLGNEEWEISERLFHISFKLIKAAKASGDFDN